MKRHSLSVLGGEIDWSYSFLKYYLKTIIRIIRIKEYYSSTCCARGLNCLKTTTKWYQVFLEKISSLLDTIILVVLWTDAKRLVWHRQLNFHNIFVMGPSKLEKIERCWVTFPVLDRLFLHTQQKLCFSNLTRLHVCFLSKMKPNSHIF